MMPNGNEEYNQRQHKAALPRAIRVFKLRVQKKTWKEIGILLGVSPQRAQQIHKAHPLSAGQRAMIVVEMHKGQWAKPGRPRKAVK